MKWAKEVYVVKRYQFWNFFLTNSTKVKNFKKVPIKYITAEEILALWQQGKLYIKEESPEYTVEEIKNNVCAYVIRLRAYATSPFADHIDEIWEEILEDEIYLPYIIPDAHARKCRELNKNGIMRIVGVLRSIGIYQNLTDSRICSILEQNTKDCSYRAYLGRGVRDEIRIELKRLKKSFVDF